jgi:hypothetical protein
VRVILLGPQRRPTVDSVVRSLASAGPFVTVTAGWQEREPDDGELSALLGGRDVFARRFAPAHCLLLEAGTRVEFSGDGVFPPGTRVLGEDGHVRLAGEAA